MKLKKGILFLAFLLLVHLPCMAGELITIKDLQSRKPIVTAAIPEHEAKEIFRNYQQQASSILNVYLVINGIPATTPLSGKYEMKGSHLSFTPMVALGEDLEFEVVYSLNETKTTKRFHTPAKPVSNQVTSVVTSYPTAETIPYNTLFFHVRFTAPMFQDRKAYEHVHIFNDENKEIWNAWRQKSFWLDDGKLLVVMVHPGRVKTGIRYAGPLFDSTKQYKLVVSRNLKDANGNMLKSDYERLYRIGGEDRESPVAVINKHVIPNADTRQPVKLEFSEGMDYASVFDGTKLYDNKGSQIACTIETDEKNQTFLLKPHENWRKGKYTLSLRGDVYDFAANRINRLFEITDIRQVESDKIPTELFFEIQ